MAMIHKMDRLDALRSDLPKPIFGERLVERNINENAKNCIRHRQ